MKYNLALRPNIKLSYIDELKNLEEIVLVTLLFTKLQTRKELS